VDIIKLNILGEWEFLNRSESKHEAYNGTYSKDNNEVVANKRRDIFTYSIKIKNFCTRIGKRRLLNPA
jgi:hypothetical protein